MNDLLVHARDVSMTFGIGSTAVVAVSGVTCEVHAGEHIALSGPSGSGKSTLLHLLAGLETPTKGMVEWPALGTRRDLRPGQVAIVFQSPSLLPPLDVLENVTLPLLLQGIQRDTARTAGMEALRRLDLESIASKLPDEVSGGQAQRVAVARVLAASPRLILADEPTGQLDHSAGAVVIESLLAAARHTGAALIVNTHDSAVADRFAINWRMTAGKLTQREPASC
jgi:ABC-type lipoprotein export system ATPase subunit